MARDPNDPLVPPAPALPEPAEHKGHVVCGFCDCTLTRRRGEVLNLSDKAKRFRDREYEHERELKQKNDELVALRAEHDALKAKLPPSEPARKRGVLFGGE